MFTTDRIHRTEAFNHRKPALFQIGLWSSNTAMNIG